MRVVKVKSRVVVKLRVVKAKLGVMKGKLRGPNEGWNNPLPHLLLTIVFETTTTTTKATTTTT